MYKIEVDFFFNYLRLCTYFFGSCLLFGPLVDGIAKIRKVKFVSSLVLDCYFILLPCYTIKCCKRKVVTIDCIYYYLFLFYLSFVRFLVEQTTKTVNNNASLCSSWLRLLGFCYCIQNFKVNWICYINIPVTDVLLLGSDWKHYQDGGMYFCFLFYSVFKENPCVTEPDRVT